MSARRLLVVVTAEVADGVLRVRLRSRAGNGSEMLLIAPAAEIPQLDWLTSAGNHVRARAGLGDQAGWLQLGAGARAQTRLSLPAEAYEDGSPTRPGM